MKRNNDNKKQNQITLRAFNFTKTITQDSVEENAEFVAPEENGSIFNQLDQYYRWYS